MFYRKFVVVLLAVVISTIAACDSQSPTSSVLQGDYRDPVVRWLSPAPGTTLRDTVILSFSVTDDSPIDSTVLFLNGIRHIQLPGSDSLYVWNSKSVEDGAYSWGITAYDSAGNSGSAQALFVRVKNGSEDGPDRTPPVIQLLEPAPGSQLAGDAVLRYLVQDQSPLDAVEGFINGSASEWAKVEPDTGSVYELIINTLGLEDGNQNITLRAIDTADNIAWSSNSFRVLNHPPRVIWVPDEFAKIQDAVLASRDGDTIMVRRGEYNESVMMFYKKVSLISEEGPEVTTINSSGFYRCPLGIEGGQDTTSLIRGFTFTTGIMRDGGAACLYVKNRSGAKIVNNIFTARDDAVSGYWSNEDVSIVRNNLYIDLGHGAQVAICWRDWSNNMVIRCKPWAFWNSQINGQILIPDYNLFWDSGAFESRDMKWGEHNIYDQDPLFIDGSFQLQDNSPARNGGRPDVFNLDGSRSDIGVNGGPFAYRHD